MSSGPKSRFAFSGELKPGTYEHTDKLEWDLTFNTQSAKFTKKSVICPVTGVYVFHLSILAGIKRCAAIVHGQAEKARVLANDKDLSSQASNMVTFVCNQGDKVWVQSCSEAGGEWEEIEDMASMFTGFMLYKKQ